MKGIKANAIIAILIMLAGTPASAAITDDAFWRMVSTFSEDGGAFREQLMSNEIGSQYVIPELQQIARPGGAYLGVGPEQNFTYIAALRPKIAFIIDIRRQNMLEHLIYKSVFEMSANRTEFVSRLFSRAPQGADVSLTARALFQAYAGINLDSSLVEQNLKAIKANLIQEHHFGLTNADQAELDTLYRSLCDLGPASWKPGAQNAAAYYGNLMTDTDKLGQEHSYLATENNYQSVRAMERENLIIPLVGDFGGSKTLRSVGQYLSDEHLSVSMFYISNVEDYLFSPDKGTWRLFYGNVGSLPMNASSTFIRSKGTTTITNPRPPGTSFASMLSSMREIVQDFEQGRIQNQEDVLKLSRKP